MNPINGLTSHYWDSRLNNSSKRFLHALSKPREGFESQVEKHPLPSLHKAAAASLRLNRPNSLTFHKPTHLTVFPSITIGPELRLLDVLRKST